MNDTSDIAVQIAKYKAIMGDWKVCHYWRNPRFLHTFLSAVNWECVVSDIFVKSAENGESAPSFGSGRSCSPSFYGKSLDLPVSRDHG